MYANNYMNIEQSDDYAHINCIRVEFVTEYMLEGLFIMVTNSKKHRVVYFIFTKITDLYVTDTSEYDTVMIVRADWTTLMYSNDETLIQFIWAMKWKGISLIWALPTKDEIKQRVKSDETSSIHRQAMWLGLF